MEDDGDILVTDNDLRRKYRIICWSDFIEWKAFYVRSLPLLDNSIAF
jgi:hypothetical protein